jgi:membrane-associated phospholipid phosphatase
MTNKKTAALPPAPDIATQDDAQPAHAWQWGWIAVCIASLIVFALGALVAHRHILTGIELHIFRRINDLPNSLRPLFLALTIVPESLWIGVVAVIGTFVLRMYRLAWQLAAATIAGYGAAFIGKHVIGRARPEHLINDVHVRVHETGMGYPSGHTMMITIVVLTLWPYMPKGWRWGVALLIPAMALSRVYLGVHSPLDVVGGFAVGAGVVAAIRSLPPVVRRFFRFD